ncbi:SPL family radical SAM protein [Cohnella fermenti]|uniref:Radical SAM protein n=1 Tax=Cohnella fermenti TaxID=2565925 RepID=A0A4S4BLD1_9BACL|nr:radical SAM protein [Cohnella fermenti]THF74616.1 radical SAM protein [Cohnella fermenti]
MPSTPDTGDEHAIYRRRTPKSMLNAGTGFLSGYTHSLNPYAGCSFACSYCYVRGIPVASFRGLEWGKWVDIKEEAAAVFEKDYRRARARGPVTIFMSSSTDPYQPIEHREQITRSLLEAMTKQPPEFLLVQTRSPLVTRDIDLLRQLGDRVRVSVTVETDREDIRKAFTPSAPPVAARIATLRKLTEAGIPTQAAIAPLLPSSESFPSLLRPVTDRVCLDDYFMGDGSGGRRTGRLGIEERYRELGLLEWYRSDAYILVRDRLLQAYPAEAVRISRSGFEP